MNQYTKIKTLFVQKILIWLNIELFSSSHALIVRTYRTDQPTYENDHDVNRRQSADAVVGTYGLTYLPMKTNTRWSLI